MAAEGRATTQEDRKREMRLGWSREGSEEPASCPAQEGLQDKGQAGWEAQGGQADRVRAGVLVTCRGLELVPDRTGLRQRRT